MTNHNLPQGASQSVPHQTLSVLRPSIQIRKKHFNRERTEETSERAAEERSLSQDGL